MNPPIDHAKTLFLQAIESHPPEQWEEYLENACAGDSDLRARVADLLKAHQELGSFRDDAQARASTIDMPATEHLGAIIGPYKLLQQIGEGGMGIVYMAEQTAPVRRKVALKVIKPGMDTRQVIVRFEAERQALALMDHPNIARVFDAGATEAGLPYFVMELVKGIPITEYCDLNNLPMHDRLELFITVCHAVQHAHQKGIIHRDIKPSNIMITLHDGQPVVKVIDFGIAKAVNQQLTEKTLFTHFAQMVGTPLYMSPEQAELTGLDVDTRTDVYALGVLLYELLTGTTPFEQLRMRKAALEEIRRIIREEEFPRPSTRLSSTEGGIQTAVASHRHIDPGGLSRLVRGDLDWIAMKALEKDRTRRYATANDFAADIVRYLSDEPVEACPPSALYRIRKLVRRRRGLVLGTTLFGLLLILGTIISTWLAIRAMDAEHLAASRLEAETAAKSQAIQAVHEGQHRLYQAKLAEAKARRLTGHIGQRYQSLEALAEAAKLARELKLDKFHQLETRNETIASLMLPDLRPVRGVSAGLPPGTMRFGAIGPDLTFFARQDSQGRISVRSLDDGRELVQLTIGAKAGVAFCFSPSGNLLAIRYQEHIPGQSTNLEVWDWRKAKRIFQPGFSVSKDAFAFSPDERRLALGQEDGVVTLHEIATGQEVLTLKAPLIPTMLTFSPDGAQLAVSGRSSPTVYLHELTTGRLIVALDHPDKVMAVSWHPKNSILATACHDYQVYLWDIPQGVNRTILRGHRSIVYTVAFSPDGEFLLSESTDGSTQLWNIWTNQRLLTLPGRFGRFSADGQCLASWVGDTIQVWEFTPSGEFRISEAEGIALYQAEGHISPNGQYFAASVGKGVQLWNLATGQSQGVIPLRKALGVRFHPKGTELFIGAGGGLYRCELRQELDSLNIGPPQKLWDQGSLVSVDLDGEGRVLAATDRRGGWIWNLERRSDPPLRFDHPGAFYVSVSPDGRRIASGSWLEELGVKIWDAQSGKLERDLDPQARGAIVKFSPDGQLLVSASGEKFTFWETGSWNRVSDFPATGPNVGHAAFSPDGKTVALKTASNIVQLVDLSSGESFATLQLPHQDYLTWLTFSPEGEKLVTMLMGQPGMATWNIQSIRDRLQELGLDWTHRSHPRSGDAGRFN